jgi:putative DNA primase/helicase
MPNAIHLEHFNAIAGLDGYRDVRLLITIGRTVPSPFEVEATAGLLSGIEPVKASIQQNGGTWFNRVPRGVRLKSGAGVEVSCDQHPDPLAEAVRWQVCEGELLQAIGRGRGVNRTAGTPLDIDILADVVLPLEVDQVAEWVAPGKETEMEAEGVRLDSPTDMAKAWPAVWASPEAAKEWKKAEQRGEFLYIDSSKGKPPCVRYQLPGAKQKWKEAKYDPGVITDLRGWLEARLGPLAGFEAIFPRFAVDIGVPAGGKITLEMVVWKGAAREVRVAFSEMRL